MIHIDIVPVFPVQEIFSHDRCPWKECNYHKHPNLAKIHRLIAAENTGSECDHPSLPFMVSQRNRELAWEWEGKAPGHLSSCSWTCHFSPAGPCVGIRISTLLTLQSAGAPEEPESLFRDREFTQRIPLLKGTQKPKRRLQTKCKTPSQPSQNRFVYPFTEILSCYFSSSITLFIRVSSF